MKLALQHLWFGIRNGERCGGWGWAAVWLRVWVNYYRRGKTAPKCMLAA